MGGERGGGSSARAELLRQVGELARRVPHPFGLKTRDYRAALVNLCTAAGLETSTRETVKSRGTRDGYRGRLDLVVRHPVTGALLAVEIDKAVIQSKTINKFKALPEAQPAARLVILTRAAVQPSRDALPAVVDAVITLA